MDVFPTDPKVIIVPLNHSLFWLRGVSASACAQCDAEPHVRSANTVFNFRLIRGFASAGRDDSLGDTKHSQWHRIWMDCTILKEIIALYRKWLAKFSFLRRDNKNQDIVRSMCTQQPALSPISLTEKQTEKRVVVQRPVPMWASAWSE